MQPTFDRSRGGSFPAWVYTVTRSRAADYHRRRDRQPDAVGGTDFGQQLAEQPAPDESSTAPPTDRELAPAVRRAMDEVQARVDERTWRAFWLVVVEERDSAEVAATLGMKNAAAVRLAKSRVLRRLQRLLEGA